MRHSTDARSAWNAVERLAKQGDLRHAEALRALLCNPLLEAALDQIAERDGTTGGTRCARQAAEQALFAWHPIPANRE